MRAARAASGPAPDDESDFSRSLATCASAPSMNAPERIDLPDIQSREDRRELRIDAVGVSGVRCPVTVRTGGNRVTTVATFSLSVALPPTARGTHMSRFIELVERRREPLDAAGFRALAHAMLQRLDARSGTIEMRFTHFVAKVAPVSGVRSLLDYDVRWRADAAADGGGSFSMRVVVPVTSLCPCSKEISDYGAHNQRSHVTIDADLESDMDVDELIAIAERSASCEVYGLLKRVDEKYVTERAYDNPRFVEDLVREVALALDGEPRVRAFVVEAENFESIHNHSAVAKIVRTAGRARTRDPVERRRDPAPSEDIA
jgi:GTP cyclohydrolase FolE2